MCRTLANIETHADISFARQQCKKMVASTPAKIKEVMDDLPGWRKIIVGLRQVEPLAATAKKLREVDIPKLEEDLAKAESKHASATAKAEEVSRHHIACPRFANSG